MTLTLFMLNRQRAQCFIQTFGGSELMASSPCNRNMSRRNEPISTKLFSSCGWPEALSDNAC